MLKSSFEFKIKVMACISAIEGLCVILFIIGLLMRNRQSFIYAFAIYLICKAFGYFIWRCPKCKKKLPKGNTLYINTCSYCYHELR